MPPGSTWCVPPSHNNNLQLHQQLFPDSVKYLPSVISSERLCRYERALSKGHRTSLDDNRFSADSENNTSQLDMKVLKQEVVKCLQDGFKLRFDSILFPLVDLDYLW